MNEPSYTATPPPPIYFFWTKPKPSDTALWRNKKKESFWIFLIYFLFDFDILQETSVFFSRGTVGSERRGTVLASRWRRRSWVQGLIGMEWNSCKENYTCLWMGPEVCKWLNMPFMEGGVGGGEGVESEPFLRFRVGGGAGLVMLIRMNGKQTNKCICVTLLLNYCIYCHSSKHSYPPDVYVLWDNTKLKKCFYLVYPQKQNKPQTITRSQFRIISKWGTGPFTGPFTGLGAGLGL